MQPDQALRQALLDLYSAMCSGNAGAVEALYSLQPGSVFIGTDTGEFWTDSQQHNRDVRHFFDGSQERLQIHTGDAMALVEGSVGWTIDRPTFVLPDGTEFALRLTLIWHREGDVWQVVHSHASLGGG